MTGCIRCFLLGSRRVSLFKNVGELNRLMALICGGLFVMIIYLLSAVRLTMPIPTFLGQLNIIAIVVLVALILRRRGQLKRLCT